MLIDIIKYKFCIYYWDVVTGKHTSKPIWYFIQCNVRPTSSWSMFFFLDEQVQVITFILISFRYTKVIQLHLESEPNPRSPGGGGGTYCPTHWFIGTMSRHYWSKSTYNSHSLDQNYAINLYISIYEVEELRVTKYSHSVTLLCNCHIFVIPIPLESICVIVV